MNLTIIGSGYVGLTTAPVLRKWATTCICVDNNAEKIRTLQSGSIPIYEPKLEELVKKNVAVGRLEFSPSIADSIAESEVIFIAVPTPPNTDGSVDLTYIEKVAREIAQVLQPEMGYKVIVDKSTVPVKTGEKVRQTIKRYAGTDVQFDIVSNPEFLREGCAVDDLLHPDPASSSAPTRNVPWTSSSASTSPSTRPFWKRTSTLRSSSSTPPTPSWP